MVTAHRREHSPLRALGPALAALGFFAAVLAGASGCQLVTAVDRDDIPAPTSGSGGTGGTGGQGGEGGGQGGGGAPPISCDAPDDCPGVDDECQARTCEDHACGVHYAPENKLTAAQTPSDCKRNVCDGQGNVVSVDDDMDVLVDGDPCTSDVCVMGAPANPPAPATTVCDVGGGHFCDGNGACVECLVGGDCPQGVCMANACVPATCVDGVHNGQETDLDCGGPACPPCADLQSCAFGPDCQSGVCFLGHCKASICGDGQVNGADQCDDGGTQDGDGCSAACMQEPGYQCTGNPSACVLVEVEPNDTFADADARALDPVPIVVIGDGIVGGGIGAAGDIDVFKIVLAADEVVRLETFDAGGVDCAGITTTLRLFDAAQAPLYVDTVAGDISGINGCSSLVVRLAAGTYYVQVEEDGNDATIPEYRLEVKRQTLLGTEVEVNDTPAAASALPGSNVFVFGDHQANADLDFFAITVPSNGMSVVAELIEGSAAETCESGEIDAVIGLYDSGGALLVEDDDDGRGSCSKIDGSGATPADVAAHDLAAGTYYLGVRAISSSTTGQFDYRLVAAIRAP